MRVHTEEDRGVMKGEIELVIRSGTYNIQNKRNEGIDLALRGVA